MFIIVTAKLGILVAEIRNPRYEIRNTRTTLLNFAGQEGGAAAGAEIVEIVCKRISLAIVQVSRWINPFAFWILLLLNKRKCEIRVNLIKNVVL